jgi:predicted small lipoprotein YifL
VRTPLALVAVLVLAGCGGSGSLQLVSAEPPAGAQAAGRENTRQGTPDADSGEPIFTLEPAEGSELSYTVRVRNTGDEAVRVTGVVADKSRDGAFVPERVERAPVTIDPGATEELVIAGHVRGCRFGGQKVALAGPELKLADGGSQSFDLGIQVELHTARCGV